MQAPQIHWRDSTHFRCRCRLGDNKWGRCSSSCGCRVDSRTTRSHRQA